MMNVIKVNIMSALVLVGAIYMVGWGTCRIQKPGDRDYIITSTIGIVIVALILYGIILIHKIIEHFGH